MPNKPIRIILILRLKFAFLLLLAVMPYQCKNNVAGVTTIINKPTINYNELRTVFKIPDKFINTQIDTVIEISKRMEIPRHISFNLIFKESCFDSTVTSPVGCYGYMQLHPRYFTTSTSYDNILQGLNFLKEQHDRFGNWDKALTYYNSGESMYRNSNFVNYILTNGK